MAVSAPPPNSVHETQNNVRWGSMHHVIRVALVVFALSLPSLARAHTITVTSLTAADAADATCTVREALDVATGGPAHAECAPTGPAGVLVIQLPAGTATIVAERTPNHAGWADFAGTLVLRGAGIAMTRVHNASATPTRLLSVLGGGDVTLEAMSVDGFDANPGEGSGGTIYVAPNAALTVRDVAFSDCHSSSQGAVISAPFTGGATTRVTVERCTFDHNDTAIGGGGVIDLVDTTIVIDGSTFTANEGVITNVLSLTVSAPGYTATIRTSTFEDNVTTRFGTGGALRFHGPVPVLVEDCVFTGNASAGSSAAIVADSPLTVTGSTFDGNRSGTVDGGAISGTEGMTIMASTFTDNVSGAGGGAIATGYRPCVVDGCRFERNAALHGGAIYHHSSSLTVTGSIFVDDVAETLTVGATATDDRATEGGDDGEITVARTGQGSAIATNGALTVHGSCFVGGVRHVVWSGGPAVDATGNYWTSTDPAVRGDVHLDASGDLTAPPMGCDPTTTLTLGGLTVTTDRSGTATSGDDYVAFPVPIVFAPGASDVVVPIVALVDSVADPEESVDLGVTYLGGGTVATVRITDTMAADLSIVKVADVTSARIGDPIVFTLTVANLGPGDANDVVVTDLLPAGLALVGATIDAPATATATCEPGPPASCTVSVLAAGEMASVTVRTTVAAGSDITNRAEVVSVADPDPTNDTAEVHVAVVGADAAVPGSDGGVTPSDGGSPRSDAGADAGPIVAGHTGCGCRVGSTRSHAWALAALAALAVLVVGRRRRA